MLTVQIDANGVAIQQVTRKPDLDFTQPKDPSDMPFVWTMRDADGRAIAEGGFDPAKLCLDPTHLGQPPHLEGDLAVPHLTHTNVKVPDLAAFDRIEFAFRDQGVARPFGVTQKSTLTLR